MRFGSSRRPCVASSSIDWCLWPFREPADNRRLVWSPGIGNKIEWNIPNWLIEQIVWDPDLSMHLHTGVLNKNCFTFYSLLNKNCLFHLLTSTALSLHSRSSSKRIFVPVVSQNATNYLIRKYWYKLPFRTRFFFQTFLLLPLELTKCVECPFVISMSIFLRVRVPPYSSCPNENTYECECDNHQKQHLGVHLIEKIL